MGVVGEQRIADIGEGGIAGGERIFQARPLFIRFGTEYELPCLQVTADLSADQAATSVVAVRVCQRRTVRGKIACTGRTRWRKEARWNEVVAGRGKRVTISAADPAGIGADIAAGPVRNQRWWNWWNWRFHVDVGCQGGLSGQYGDR